MSGKTLLIYISNFHVLSHLLLIYLCKLHWNYWGVGFGLLYIYVDDMYSPVITTPLNLDSTLHLDNGRMYVGLTAATGDSHFQVYIH